MIKPEHALLYYLGGLIRSYSRLQKIERGQWHEKDFGSELDLYYCFFMRCYHLKDWLAGTVVLGSKETIEQFVNESPELSLCGDICNSTKHFMLDERKRKREERLRILLGPGEGISLFREYDPLIARQGRRKYRIRLEATERRWDAIELATTCMEQWKQFVESHSRIRLPNLPRKAPSTL